ncbi:sugar transferase [Ornithinicoccus halotolerans]|uniref:sugar transferase n=1 Tax=Ornithinicoccus halotolerans TaxID=1748220 RepID=UPI001E561F17|nr:sugar transferase [Ornithinicoccus halotolerans]
MSTLGGIPRVDRAGDADQFFVLPGGSGKGGPQPGAQLGGRRRLSRYLWALRMLDLGIVVAAVVLAQLIRFGFESATVSANEPIASGLSYTLLSAALVVGWVGLLHLHGAYDGRLSGHGVQEYRAVVKASGWLFGALAVVGYAAGLDIARGYVLVAFPVGTLLLLLGHWRARRWLVQRRARGEHSDRVLIVGDRAHAPDLVAALCRTPAAGLDVVGLCSDDVDDGELSGVPVLGTEADVLVQAMAQQVDVVAVSSSAGLGAAGLRRLGWALEGTGIDLVVAPGILEVAGPRVMTRPIRGLPLLHVEAPCISGPRRVAKAVLDRVGSLLLLLVLSPLLAVLAFAVWREDRGPVLFRQVRVGQDGRPFTMLKLRTMITDAEQRLPTLMAANEGAGPLFKLREDPRVTRAGKWLRRYSLDELPQLVNVLRGEMSLVGPRPPLPREVAEYDLQARRRLLVQPGMTGLWQISGRSDLSWSESVRLDLYYVENWTPLLDLMILWRTARVVAGSEAGAY